LASEFDTLDELRGSLRDGVERMALVDQGMAAREKALDLLLEATDIPIPESLLEEHLGEHFEDGHGDDDHREEVRAEAEKATKTRFILDKIADNEELSVGQGELTKWLMGQAPRYGMTPDQFAEALVQAGQVQSAIADVRRGKALALVLQKAVVTDASGNVVNLSALDEPTAEEQIAQLVEQAQAAAAAAGERDDEVLDGEILEVPNSELDDASQAGSSEADQR
jgi:trigger factor